MKRKLMGTYRCTSTGPQNNGLLKECNFEQRMEDGYQHHCPICSSRLEYRSQGPSVTELLQSGLRRERQS